MSLAILNDTKYFVCPGIGDYSTYRQSIGFDRKVVVRLALPIDAIGHNAPKVTSMFILCIIEILLEKTKDSDEFEVNHEEHKKLAQLFHLTTSALAVRKQELPICERKSIH